MKNLSKIKLSNLFSFRTKKVSLYIKNFCIVKLINIISRKVLSLTFLLSKLIKLLMALTRVIISDLHLSGWRFDTIKSISLSMLAKNFLIIKRLFSKIN